MDSSQSSLELNFSQILVSHIDKNLRNVSREKLNFDVFLTREVRDSHMTLSRGVYNWVILRLKFSISKNLLETFSAKN